jgi:hypothetical protein
LLKARDRCNVYIHGRTRVVGSQIPEADGSWEFGAQIIHPQCVVGFRHECMYFIFIFVHYLDESHNGKRVSLMIKTGMNLKKVREVASSERTMVINQHRESDVRYRYR